MLSQISGEQNPGPYIWKNGSMVMFYRAQVCSLEFVTANAFGVQCLLMLLLLYLTGSPQILLLLLLLQVVLQQQQQKTTSTINHYCYVLVHSCCILCGKIFLLQGSTSSPCSGESIGVQYCDNATAVCEGGHNLMYVVRVVAGECCRHLSSLYIFSRSLLWPWQCKITLIGRWCFGDEKFFCCR